MWFLIKGSVWFAIVLVGLSYFSSQPAADIEAGQTLEIGDAFQAATQAYRYVSDICVEKPEVCVKGAETMSALGIRAKEGARVAFELLDKQFGGQTGQLGEETASEETAAEDVTQTTLLSAPDPQPMPARLTGAASTRSEPIVTGAIPVPQKRPKY